MYWGWLTASYPPTPKGEELPSPVAIPAPGTTCSLEVKTYVDLEVTFFCYFLGVLITTMTVAFYSLLAYALVFQLSIFPLKTNLISVGSASKRSARSATYSSTVLPPSYASSMAPWLPCVLLKLIIGVYLLYIHKNYNSQWQSYDIITLLFSVAF